MSDTQLPPVGSLWLHRETGERRFVTFAGVVVGLVLFVSLCDGGLLDRDMSETIADWLAWQAGAERIDRETA